MCVLFPVSEALDEMCEFLVDRVRRVEMSASITESEGERGRYQNRALNPTNPLVQLPPEEYTKLKLNYS